MSNESPAKLWPQPIEIIGVTGEYGSGKTLFGLTIDPKRTRCYDTERSSGSYETLGFERVSVQDIMQKLKPAGYKPMDLFMWWWDDIKKIERNKFSVIMIDTISEIEEGLVEWVQKNPGHFGKSPGQYARMAGLMWGDVKSLWKSILSDLSARCQTFVFATHMANVWSGDRPTGKRKPKGKETLMELASLYLMMERKPEAKTGQPPAKPAAIVLKSRLVHTTMNGETMELELVPCLPPRIPVCTPAQIREYMNKPPDYKNLKKDERVHEDKLSEDEKSQIALARAEAEADVERMKLERTILEKQHDKQDRKQESDAQAMQHKAESTAGYAKPEWPELPREVPSITADQIQRMANLRSALLASGATEDAWRSLVQAKGVQKARELTEPQAAAFIVELEVREAGGVKNGSGGNAAA